MDKEMTFEQAMKRLEEIAAIIQKNECTLDEGLKLYEEGLKLAAFCDEKLTVFQNRLNELASKEEFTNVGK